MNAYLEQRSGEERDSVRADERTRQARPLVLLVAVLLLAVCGRDGVRRLLAGRGVRVRLVRDAGAARLPGLFEALAEGPGGVVGLRDKVSTEVGA